MVLLDQLQGRVVQVCRDQEIFARPNVLLHLVAVFVEGSRFSQDVVRILRISYSPHGISPSELCVGLQEYLYQACFSDSVSLPPTQYLPFVPNVLGQTWRLLQRAFLRPIYVRIVLLQELLSLFSITRRLSRPGFLAFRLLWRLLADLRLEEGLVVLEPATIWQVPQPHLLVEEAFPVLQVDHRLIVAYEPLAPVFVTAGRLLFEEYL
jgi:hypothetical protein